MEEIIELLKGSDYHLPRILLSNYKKLNITEQELVIIIYLINLDNLIYNPKAIAKELNVKMADVLETISNLTEKGILNIDIVKNNKVSSEVINLDLLYEKLAFLIIKKDEKNKKPVTLYETFESELGRGLTPMEYEIINGWLGINYSEELIICALKEAIYNGVSNFRYIDRILFEWQKKGIKNKEDVEKNKKEFKKDKANNNKELFDYDWLNDDN